MIRGRQSKSAPVGVVAKVLRILEALHNFPAGLGLKEIAQETAMNKSTAYRFLAHLDLESEGYLFRDDAGAYIVGPKLIRLGSGITYQASLGKISRPVLQKLWKITGETVNLAVLDGQDVLYLDVMESTHTFRLVSQVGMRRPLYCTALGKALAAYLPAEGKEDLLSSLSSERFAPRTLTRPDQLRKELARVRQRATHSTTKKRCRGPAVLPLPFLLAAAKEVPLSAWLARRRELAATRFRFLRQPSRRQLGPYRLV